MNNYDLWKLTAAVKGKSTNKDRYSKKNWLYAGFMLLVFVGIVLLQYVITLVWN